MLPAIKSEARKLFTVRSTYVITFIALALITFMSFYLEGYWGQTGSAASTLQPSALAEIIRNNLGIVAMFVSIIAILQTGHEYRHNTIMYTLTAVSRRSKIFLAKVAVLSIFAVGFGILAISFALIMYYFGLSLRGASLPAQEFSILSVLPRSIIYIVIYSLLGLFLTLLIRNLIGAIVIMLIYPTTLEPIAGLLLKNNGAYLPVSMFDHIIGVALQPNETISPNRAIIFSTLYMTILGLVAFILFLRRDAN